MTKDKWSAGRIKGMWSERAKSVETEGQVTHRDQFQRNLEVGMLSSRLQEVDSVLDVGCGNGWSTVRLAEFCASIVGMDYSEEMVSRARQEHGEVVNVDWSVGDVLALSDVERFDVVTTTRCLINITDWTKQRHAIENIHRAIKPGGRLLMLEGIADGRAELSQLRVKFGLAPLPNVPHNLDFARDETLRFLGSLFLSVELEANGVYDLITRALYPRMILPEEPEFNTKLHALSAELSKLVDAGQNLSRFGLFTCTKSGNT